MQGEEYIKKLLPPCVRETSNEVAERVSLIVNLLSLNITRYTLNVKPLSLFVIFTPLSPYLHQRLSWHVLPCRKLSAVDTL